MASGDSLVFFYGGDGRALEASENATVEPTAINAAASSDEYFLAVEFDNSINDFVDFFGFMPPNYDGGGVTCTVMYTHSNTSSTVQFELAFRNMGDNVDVSNLYVYTYNAAAPTAPATDGIIDYQDVTFTDGVDMASVSASEYFNLRCKRNVSLGAGGELRIHGILIKET